jgi:hypothetical protein
VLFLPEGTLLRDMQIEMMLELPAELPASRGMLIRRGRIVRGAAQSSPGDRPACAAAAFEQVYWTPSDPRRI